MKIYSNKRGGTHKRKKLFWAEKNVFGLKRELFWAEKKGTRELKRKERQEEKKQK